MRIRLLSDIHLETAENRDWTPPKVDSDVVALAGDIGEGVSGLYWARKHFPNTEIVYVCGNHEFFGQRLPGGMIEARKVAAELGIHLLEQDEALIGGVRFLGTTLWTDFRFYGMDTVGEAVNVAQRNMGDYLNIRTPLGWYTPAQSITLHLRAAEWLEFKLRRDPNPTEASPEAKKLVVVTHHLPHAKSISPKFANNILNAAFASNLERLLGFSDLWLHGHTHDSADYFVEGTRIVCNPRGHPENRNPMAPLANKAFDPELVIEI